MMRPVASTAQSILLDYEAQNEWVFGLDRNELSDEQLRTSIGKLLKTCQQHKSEVNSRSKTDYNIVPANEKLYVPYQQLSWHCLDCLKWCRHEVVRPGRATVAHPCIPLCPPSPTPYLGWLLTYQSNTALILHVMSININTLKCSGVRQLHYSVQCHPGLTYHF